MTEATIIIPKDRREFSAARAQRFILDMCPGQELEVIVRKRKRERTHPQLRYLHGVAYKLLSEHTGYEREDCAEYLLGSFFGWTERKLPGNRVAKVPRRTTTKNEDGKRDVIGRVEFSEYVAFIQRVGARAGCYIPDPDLDYDQAEEA